MGIHHAKRIKMKESIRKALLDKREKHPQASGMSREIGRLLFLMEEFINAATVLFYMPIRNEVDTVGMIRDCIDHKNVALPVTDTANHRLKISRINRLDDMKVGAYGIPEPKVMSGLSADELDLVIVPGVAFDKRGNRIGYGKGYYDKLLNNLDIPKVALAYSFQVIGVVPAQEHDMKVDRIITELGVIDCS